MRSIFMTQGPGGQIYEALSVEQSLLQPDQIEQWNLYVMFSSFSVTYTLLLFF